jgi:hypothetical protein
MKVTIVEKPIKGETGIGKEFKKLVLDELPIHKWEWEQKKLQGKL